MRHIAVLAFPLLLSAGFPTFDPLEFKPAGDTWGVVHSVYMDDWSITSARYTSDGNSVIVGSDYGDLGMIEINSGRVVWRTRPFPDTKNAIYVTDVDPAGQRFLTVTSIGATDDHFTLNIHRVSDGSILHSIAEDSFFFHKDHQYELDHRKPDAAKIEEIESEQGSRYWVMRPIGARFVHGGRHILGRWANAREDYGLYDVSFRLHDASTARRIWHYQLRPDKESFDEGQPGGWQITLPTAPIAAVGQKYIYGNPHARLHILDEALIRQNERIENVLEKTTPPVFAVPRSVHSDFTDMAMAISSIEVAPDEKTVVVAAGTGGNRQVYAYDLRTKRELWHSHEYDAGYVTISPNGRFLATGYLSGGGSRVHLIDLKDMKHNYSGPRFGSMVTNTVQFNPRYAEALIVRGTMVCFLKKIPVRKIAVGTDWKGAGIYVRRGGSFYAFGKGEIEVSTGETTDSRWSRSETDDLFFGEADGRVDFGGDRSLEGQVYFRSDEPATWEVYGGLSLEEFRSVERLRAGRW